MIDNLFGLDDRPRKAPRDRCSQLQPAQQKSTAKKPKGRGKGQAVEDLHDARRATTADLLPVGQGQATADRAGEQPQIPVLRTGPVAPVALTKAQS